MRGDFSFSELRAPERVEAYLSDDRIDIHALDASGTSLLHHLATIDFKVENDSFELITKLIKKIKLPGALYFEIFEIFGKVEDSQECTLILGRILKALNEVQKKELLGYLDDFLNGRWRSFNALKEKGVQVKVREFCAELRKAGIPEWKEVQYGKIKDEYDLWKLAQLKDPNISDDRIIEILSTTLNMKFGNQVNQNLVLRFQQQCKQNSVNARYVRQMEKTLRTPEGLKTKAEFICDLGRLGALYSNEEEALACLTRMSDQFFKSSSREIINAHQLMTKFLSSDLAFIVCDVLGEPEYLKLAHLAAHRNWKNVLQFLKNLRCQEKEDLFAQTCGEPPLTPFERGIKQGHQAIFDWFVDEKGETSNVGKYGFAKKDLLMTILDLRNDRNKDVCQSMVDKILPKANAFLTDKYQRTACYYAAKAKDEKTLQALYQKRKDHKQDYHAQNYLDEVLLVLKNTVIYEELEKIKTQLANPGILANPFSRMKLEKELRELEREEKISQAQRVAIAKEMVFAVWGPRQEKENFPLQLQIELMKILRQESPEQKKILFLKWKLCNDPNNLDFKNQLNELEKRDDHFYKKALYEAQGLFDYLTPEQRNNFWESLNLNPSPLLMKFKRQNAREDVSRLWDGAQFDQLPDVGNRKFTALFVLQEMLEDYRFCRKISSGSLHCNGLNFRLSFSEIEKFKVILFSSLAAGFWNEDQLQKCKDQIVSILPEEKIRWLYDEHLKFKDEQLARFMQLEEAHRRLFLVLMPLRVRQAAPENTQSEVKFETDIGLTLGVQKAILGKKADQKEQEPQVAPRPLWLSEFDCGIMHSTIAGDVVRLKNNDKIYYGRNALLKAGKDPINRRPINFEKDIEDVTNLYRVKFLQAFVDNQLKDKDSKEINATLNEFVKSYDWDESLLQQINFPRVCAVANGSALFKPPKQDDKAQEIPLSLEQAVSPDAKPSPEKSAPSEPSKSEGLKEGGAFLWDMLDAENSADEESSVNELVRSEFGAPVELEDDDLGAVLERGKYVGHTMFGGLHSDEEDEDDNYGRMSPTMTNRRIRSDSD